MGVGGASDMFNQLSKRCCHDHQNFILVVDAIGEKWKQFL